MRDLWDGLPAGAQDGLLFALLLAPAVLTGLVVLRGYRPWSLLAGLIGRHAGVSAIFVGLIAVSVGLGAGLTAQERGLRAGTARAADPFDLIVAAPGSEVTAMLAAVYLQPTALPLLDGAVWDRVAGAEGAGLAAPIAFGDSWRGAPVVGTTPDFVRHMAAAGDGTVEGRVFAAVGEAVAGARVPLEIGATFEPVHGETEPDNAGGEDHGDEDGVHAAHEGAETTIVGRLPATGSPWDDAILVPVEAVWQVHGLADGHGPDWDGAVGPPFVADRFPGTPAILVRAESFGATYGLQAAFSTDRTMAFFPGAVLSRLHGLLGDVRQVLSLMAWVTQGLVAAGVLTGLVLLVRLLSRRLALLRALGAPARFVFALTWGFATVLIGTGAMLGLILGWGAARAISAVVAARTDIAVEAAFGWPELHLVAGFVGAASLLALVPAAATVLRPVLDDLRG